MESVAGRVALVTGGAQGIGEAVARRLAEQGAKVVIADIDAGKGEALARELDGSFVSCNVGRWEDNQAAVAAAMEHYGGLHIVALNAGVAPDCGAGETFDPEKYRLIRSVNFDGPHYGAHAAYPALRVSGGGVVIVTSSIAGLLEAPVNPEYASTKAGVVGLARALGPNWKDQGVRVNAVCPGFADTPLIAGARGMLDNAGFPVMELPEVVDGFFAVLEHGRPGECWSVLPGLPPKPYSFGGIEGYDQVYPIAPADVRRPSVPGKELPGTVSGSPRKLLPPPPSGSSSRRR